MGGGREEKVDVVKEGREGMRLMSPFFCMHFLQLCTNIIDFKPAYR